MLLFRYESSSAVWGQPDKLARLDAESRLPEAAGSAWSPGSGETDDPAGRPPAAAAAAVIRSPAVVSARETSATAVA
ncbi:MAG: hypothetical protein WAK76_24695, partial [Trebonia sp.]